MNVAMSKYLVGDALKLLALEVCHESRSKILLIKVVELNSKLKRFIISFRRVSRERKSRGYGKVSQLLFGNIDIE